MKPVLVSSGRLSTLSSEPSPIPPSYHEFEKPLKFDGSSRPKFEPIDKCHTTSTAEQFSKVTREYQHQVYKPKAMPATQCVRSKSPSLQPQPTQYYTATAGPPLHNQSNIAAETKSHTEMHEATQSSERIVNISSTKKIIQFDQYQPQNMCEQRFEESFPPTTSPAPHVARQKLQPPPTPTKFIATEFRESDYDSEIESIRIRPMWTPNQADNEYLRFRHVSAPTPHRSSSVPKNSHFERVLTPMEFDCAPVEMPSKIQHPFSESPQYRTTPTHYKTQTLDRFRSKKKFNSYPSTSQDDIDIEHSSSKYRTLKSPSRAFKEETKISQYGMLNTQIIFIYLTMHGFFKHLFRFKEEKKDEKIKFESFLHSIHPKYSNSPLIGNKTAGHN